MKGWMYILECADGSYYVGSTKNLELRFAQHQAGLGAKHTAKRLPVKFVYAEEYERIDLAFAREKQVQKWRREKKEALIRREYDRLPELAKAYTSTSSVTDISTSSVTDISTSSVTDISTSSVTDISTSSVTDISTSSVTDTSTSSMIESKLGEPVEPSEDNTTEVHS